MPKELETLDKRKPFAYVGSLRSGVEIQYRHSTARVSSKFLRAALDNFADREVEAGFNKSHPPPGGFGHWIRENSKEINGASLSPQHGSHIAAILCSEAGVDYRKFGRRLMLIFPPIQED